jgi:glutathione peroxidase
MIDRMGTFRRALALLRLCLLGIAGPVLAAAAPAAAAEPTVDAEVAPEHSAHRFTFEGLDGRPIALSDFAGGPVLVVNTASFCGFTPQYEALQALHERFQARGLTILGVPSNDFGGQEPGSAAEIREFCTGIYGVRFPLTAKQSVRGTGAHPFYRWARTELGPENAPRWNFHKYLVAPDGRLVRAFPTRVRPDAPAVIEAIEALLPASGS